MKFSILLLTIILSVTIGKRINSRSTILDFDENDDWFYVPQVNGTFLLMTAQEAQIENIKLQKGRATGPIPVVFHLYTRLNPNESQIIQINDRKALHESNFNSKHQTRFITHGWRNDYNSTVNNLIKTAYLNDGDFNVFVVDWSSASKTINYYSARYSVEEVGHHIANYLDFLSYFGRMSFKTLTLVGHSLGAHCSGYAGKFARSGKIENIIGLDPAMPLFYYNKPEERLSAKDARYVETIQTNGGFLGFLNPIGQAAFYPNWGSKQPGCGMDLAGICAHERSYTLFAESISNNNFLPMKCQSFDMLLQKECAEYVDEIRMGHTEKNKNARGVYFVPTNPDEPYGHG